jgi:hypothetical protein
MIDERVEAQRPERNGTLGETVIAAHFWRNRRGEAVRIELKPLDQVTLCDIRVWFTHPTAIMQPSAKGVAIAVRRIPDLLAIKKAEATARELGLLFDEAG